MERTMIETFRDKRAEKTVEALKKNNMDAYYVHTSKEALDLVESMLIPGAVVTMGGTVTLAETGIEALLKSGKYEFLDRARPGITPEESHAVMHQAFQADAYVIGANAVTEEGELFYMDGNGNRIAAVVYGPKNVIVVVGYNKITEDREEARKRTKRIAAPSNAYRVKAKTPCVQTGICSDCTSPERICCSELYLGYQRISNRIKVIIVDEALGF